MLARRFSSLAVRSLRETTATSITLGNASAALGAAGARRDWSGRSISGIDVATSATIFKKTTTTLGFLSPLSRRLFSSSDAVAEDAVSPRLTDKSLLQTGAFIGGEFVDAGRDETTSSPSSSSSSSSSSTSNNGSSSSSSSSSPSSSSTGEPGENNIGKTYDVVNPATAESSPASPAAAASRRPSPSRRPPPRSRAGRTAPRGSAPRFFPSGRA